MAIKEILLPDIGDFKDTDIIEVLVSPGDQVKAEESLITLESDKATMEIPSPEAGTIKEVAVKVGDRINQGDLIVRLDTADETSSVATPEVEPQPEQSEPEPTAIAEEPAKPSDTPAAEAIAVRLPDIGDFHDIPVIEVLIAAGDRIEKDASIITLESDKATMEIPSPESGIIQSVQVKIGDKLDQNDLLFYLVPDQDSEPAQEPIKAKPSPVQTPAAQAPQPGAKARQAPPVIPRPDDLNAVKRSKAHASPAVRRFARELGVDLALVTGTAAKGRITKADVQDFVKKALQADKPAAPPTEAALPTIPAVNFAQFGEIETRPLSRIKKLSGAHLHRCWLNVPHVSQFDEADITELESFRKAQKGLAEKEGVKLTLMPFLMKAVATALKTMPEFNSSLSPDGEQLILKHYIHLGIAVDTPNGLVVPVVRDVDQKGIFALAQEVSEISQKARDGKLLPADLQGGCFSISSLGGIGGTAFTPIVNAPEVAILGVSRSAMKPVWNGQEFVPRLMLPLSLSYDHRVIDGVQGVRFTTLLTGLLSDIRRLLL